MDVNSNAAVVFSASPPSCEASPAFVDVDVLAGCDPNGDAPVAPKPPKLDPNEEAGAAFPVPSLEPGFDAESVEGVDEPKIPPLPKTLPPVPNADFPVLPKAEDVTNGEAELEVLKPDVPPAPPKGDAPLLPNTDPPVLKVDEPKVGGAVSSFFPCAALDPNEKPTGFPMDPDSGVVEPPKPPNVEPVPALPNGLAPKTDLGASSAALSVFVEGTENPPNGDPEPNPEPEDPKELLPKADALKGEGFDVSDGTDTSAPVSLDFSALEGAAVVDGSG